MAEFKAIKTVYSYYMPEVRAVVDEVVREFPHDVFLSSVNPGLDDFHEPIIGKLINYWHGTVFGLGGISHKYPTSGSEEGIREFMTLLVVKGVKQIYVFEGDYEGYKEIAKTRGIDTAEIRQDTRLNRIKPGYWFISNPSAINGWFINRNRIFDICEAGHKIFYDLSYLGTTGPMGCFDLSHPNIVGAVISFSKPYGLFYYRIGFTFCREEIPALYANKWFKNVFGLIIAGKLMDRIDAMSFAEKYKMVQRTIIKEINRDPGLSLEASDAFLLAYMAKEDAAGLKPSLRVMIEKFRRGDFYRFCLTPYFMEYEQRNREAERT